MNDTDAVTIGFIKVYFELDPERRVSTDIPNIWAKQFSSYRRTVNRAYVAIGHKDLPSNEAGIDYLNAIERLGGKVTRLDFCFDVCAAFDFESYYQSRLGIKKLGIPAHYRSPSGETVYVGRRTSGRMLRIYDKRGEILYRTKTDIGFDLTRFEIEVKREYVPMYRRLFMNREYSAIYNDICTRYALPGIVHDSKKLKPSQIPDKSDDPMAFVRRYRHILGEAYTQNPSEFLETIGV